jgi:hypothetical protein
VSFIRLSKPSVVFGYSAEEATKPGVDPPAGATCGLREADLVQEKRNRTAQARISRTVPRWYDIGKQILSQKCFYFRIAESAL